MTILYEGEVFKIEIYVIYKDGELYHSRGRKSTYLKESNARQVITSESKNDAELIYDDERHWNKYYDELPKSIRDEYIEQAKTHYEIRIFKDSGEVI